MRVRCLALTLMVALVFTFVSPTHAQNDFLERFLAVAAAKGNIRPGWNERVEIMIERWSTGDERAAYLQTLAEGGPQALVDAMQEAPPVGRIRVGQRLSYPLSFSRSIPQEDGGRLIRLATDRPIQGWEAVMQETTQRWAFSLIEMNVDAESKGDGVMIVGAMIKLDMENHTMSIESYDAAPMRLGNVRPGH